MAINFFGLILLMLIAFGSIKMIHHAVFFAPLRTLFGLLLLVAAVSFFVLALYQKQSMVERHLATQQAWSPTPPPPRPTIVNFAAVKTSARQIETIPTPQSTVKTSVESDPAGEVPDWVKHPDGHDELEAGIPVYVVTVTADYPCYTLGECDLALVPAVDRAVSDYAEREFPNLNASNIKLDAVTVNRLMRKRMYEVVNPKDYGKMFQEHAMLVFDPFVRASVERQSRGTVVAERLQQAAIGFGAILLALGAVHSLARQKSKSSQAVESSNTSSGR